jgi:hypothetical protein
MLKLTVAVFAIALAGTAAAGWRDLRIDASSEAAFRASMALFQSELSPSRAHAFNRALQDILGQRDYTPSELLAQFDGLSYEQVVRIPDPTGHQAKRYRAEYYRAQPPPNPRPRYEYVVPDPCRLGPYCCGPGVC